MANEDVLYTQRGPRPDLAALGALSQMDLKGYGFMKLFPLIIVNEKAGTFSFAPKGLTATKGQAGRAKTDAISVETLAPVDVEYSVSALEGRAKIYTRDVPGLGGIAFADQLGGENCCRQAWNKAEATAASTVFTAGRMNAATELADHAVIKGLQQAAKSVRGYGKPYLVMSTNGFLTFCDIPEIRQKLDKSSLATGDLGFMALSDPRVAQTLSTLMMMQGVILFDSDIVGDTYDNFIAVVSLREEAFAGGMAALGVAQRAAIYGATFMYIPKGAQGDTPFMVSSSDNTDGKYNLYDAEAHYDIEEVHTGAVAVRKFAATYTEYTVPTTQAPA